MTNFVAPGAFSPQNMSPSTPRLAQIIRDAVSSGARELRVALPAKVVAVRGDQLVDLQPLLKARFYAAREAIALPVLPTVPVVMPRGGSWGIRLPVAVGDLGLAIFSDRSLDAWAASQPGDVVDPGDPRMHQLADAVFVPGLYPDGAQTAEAMGDLVLHTGAAKLRLEASGRFQVTNGTEELVDLTKQLADAVKAMGQSLAGAAAAVSGTTSAAGSPIAATSVIGDTAIAGNVATLSALSAKLAALAG